MKTSQDSYFYQKRNTFITRLRPSGELGRLYEVNTIEDKQKAYRSTKLDIYLENSHPSDDGSPGNGRDL